MLLLEFVLILLHDRATLYPLCSACSQVMRQRMLQEVTVQNVLCVNFSSVITIINAMIWSFCLDMQFSKSLFAI